MARTLRKPLPEDVDFMHAVARGDGSAAQGALPADAQARRRASPASVATAARARSTSATPCATRCRYGGVPAEPKFKLPAPVEARDHGGRRHLRFGGGVRPLHAAARLRDPAASSRRCARSCSSTASTRSPSFFEGVEDITEAIHRVNTEADVVWVDGHSDYGHAFEVFWRALRQARSARRRR